MSAATSPGYAVPTGTKFQLSRLTHVHHKILDYALQGFNCRQIAQLMGRTPASIQYTLSSPLFQDELARRRSATNRRADETEMSNLAEHKHKINEALLEATDVQLDLMRNEDPQVQQRAVSEIFDLAYGQKQKQDQHSGPAIVLEAGAFLALQVALSEDSADGLSPSLVQGEALASLGETDVEVNSPSVNQNAGSGDVVDQVSELEGQAAE